MSIAAYTNRIHLDAKFFSQACGSRRTNVAGIVDTIGQQYDYFTLSVTVLETIDCSSESHADRGAIFQCTTFQTFQIFVQYIMIIGERALGITLSSKDSQSYTVIGTM